ncbi:MAG: FAD-dependent oxidoreductase [Bdellovibrionota bacterium]
MSRCKQSQTTQTRFWDLLILATLNVDPKRAPADLLKVVLTQGFMASCKDSASGLADVGLTELFGDAAQAYMAKKGGSIRLRETVSELILDHEKIKGVVLQNGEKVQADYVIAAIAPNHLYRLLAKESRLQTLARNVKHMESSPIVSLHIWTNRHLFDDAYVGFWDTPFHWVFRKQSFMQDQSVSHYTLVASGADDLIKKSTSDLITMAKQTLAPLCGDVSISRAKKSLMKNATWLPPLGQNIVRPNIQSQDVKGLYYAGDWVDTGLPCTIESAVKSGHMAASYIINQKFALEV